MTAGHQKEKAVAVMFEAIVGYARAKQFNRAQKLREMLIEVDAMALNEIVTSAEIIEAEMSKAIDVNHKKKWAALYNELTTEEANAFYFALKKIRVMPEKTVIQQGRLNNKLFFIEQGTLRVVYLKGGREIFLKKLFHGEVSGTHTFFSISVATASTVTIEPCTLFYLDREGFDKLVIKFAGFDRKLEQFCKKIGTSTIEDILKNKGVERRNHDRYKTAGKVAVYMMDSDKQPARVPLYGMIEDISEGGLSFIIKTSKNSTARQYLGKIVKLKALSKKTGKALSKKGIVLSVFNQLFNNYSISVRFITPISPEEVKEFAGIN